MVVTTCNVLVVPKKSVYDADPEKHRRRRRSLYHGNVDYRQGVIDRIRKRRRDDPAQYLWEKARRRAKAAGLPFTIDKADVVIPEVCPVLGIPIVVLSKTRDNSPNLDRRVGHLGYVPGNVAVISQRANRIKNDATLEELRAIVRWLERRKGRR